MAKSAISAEVSAANSKLAQFLRQREEDEMILQIGKRKPKQEREEKRMPGGRARWAAEPDFKIPSCMVDRPRSTTGATSFHFSCISISKQAAPTLGGKPLEGALGKAKQPALDHAKYIERDGAAEVSNGAVHAGYIERPAAIESIDPSALISEGIEPQISNVINEAPTDEEAQLLGVVDAAPAGIPSVFSNISDNSFMRQEYWRAIERTERTPRVHSLILDPEVSPRWWNAIAASKTIDPAFKSHALNQVEKYRQHMAAELALGDVRKPFRADPYIVNSESAGSLIQQSMSLAGYDHSMPPVEFKSGRGGRVQIRFVAELPHEVSAEDRALIVQNFCDGLASLETRIDPDGTERKVGMMYTAVIHAPDAHNDSRNYHLHVVAHDRPARYLEHEGLWDFEVQEHYIEHRKERVRWPLRHNKIGEVSQHTSRTGKERSGKDFIPAMRADFAKITNAVLKARGVDRHYDPRKYTEMGIERTPTQHLGTKAAALEAIGVPTVVGQLNAIAIWSDAEREIERFAKRQDTYYRTIEDRMAKLAIRATQYEPGNPLLDQLRILLGTRARITETLAEDRRAIMAFEHMEAKAKSRAMRTRQTCLQLLADVEEGKADGTTKVMKFAIEARWRDAQAHIASIDEALAPHRAALKEAGQNIAQLEKRVADLDAQFLVLEQKLEGRIEDLVMTGHQPVKATPASSKQREPAAPIEASAPTEASDKLDTAAQPTAAVPSAAPIAPETPATAPTPVEPMQSPAKTITQPEPIAIEAGAIAAEPDEIEAKIEMPKRPVQPVTLDGLPMVEANIEPTLDEVTAGPDLSAVAPEGLDPLRREDEAQPATTAPDTVVENISLSPAEDLQEAVSPALPAEPQESSGSDLQSGPPPVQPEVPEPKVDRRRKVEDPALFELPAQEPPVKPGTTKAELADWENLLNQIADQRIPVKVEELSNGHNRYTVPSLDQGQQRVLQASRFAKRTTGRLAAIQTRQGHEIARLQRWISTHGQDPTKLILENRTIKLGSAPKAVHTLLSHWGRHPDVVSTVRAEFARREVEAERAREAQANIDSFRLEDHVDVEQGGHLTAGLTREDIHWQAQQIYPAPDQVVTPEVAEFTRLLREVAPKAKLQEAAAKVHANLEAREDVNRYSVDFATAYARFSDSTRDQGIQPDRSIGHDRGGR
jgi:hypothetical protein